LDSDLTQTFELNDPPHYALFGFSSWMGLIGAFLGIIIGIPVIYGIFGYIRIKRTMNKRQKERQMQRLYEQKDQQIIPQEDSPTTMGGWD
jgi:uncharacterized membrane protein YciS (DUF1049 family)